MKCNGIRVHVEPQLFTVRFFLRILHRATARFFIDVDDRLLTNYKIICIFSVECILGFFRIKVSQICSLFNNIFEGEFLACAAIIRNMTDNMQNIREIFRDYVHIIFIFAIPSSRRILAPRASTLRNKA